LKVKLKGRHFDTAEVIETESQAVLNILTEHNFQDLLTIAEALVTVLTRGRCYFEGDGTPVPEIMETIFIEIIIIICTVVFKLHISKQIQANIDSSGI
jgi:hypothetical protein